MSLLLDVLLEKRSITSDQKDIFLNPDYKRDLHDPFLMRDMEKACVRIFEAIENKEKIIIYADYDCDGIPGAVILNDLFIFLGYKLAGNWNNIKKYDLSINWLLFLTSLIVLDITVIFAGWIWKIILEKVASKKIGFKTALQIHIWSWLLRYIPGKYTSPIKILAYQKNL